MSNNITFSQMLTITITPLNDIQKANDKKNTIILWGTNLRMKTN